MARSTLTIGLALGCCVMLAKPASAVISCNESAAPPQARRYVDQCRLVATASHALCRPTYSCSLIEDEIRRGCVRLGKDAPTFCVLYRRPG